MIQRIQTLYLLAAEVHIAILFFSKLASFTDNGQEMELNFKGLYHMDNGVFEKTINTWPMVILLIAASIIGFFVIFLYRRRMFQTRICFVAMILNFGFLGVFGYYVYSIAVVGNSIMTLSLVVIIPVAVLVLYYMAYKKIAKDEAMVVASSFRSRR